MDSTLQYLLTQLRKDAYLRLSNAQGRTVAVFRGQVWIAQEGDRRDVFVGSGGTFTIDRPGLVIVEALQETSLLVLEPDAPVPSQPAERRVTAPAVPVRLAA